MGLGFGWVPKILLGANPRRSAGRGEESSFFDLMKHLSDSAVQAIKTRF